MNGNNKVFCEKNFNRFFVNLFKGRVHRKHYRQWVLLTFGINFVFSIIILMSISAIGKIGFELLATRLFFLLLMGFWIIPFTVRRLHDLGSSGWVLLFPLFFIILSSSFEFIGGFVFEFLSMVSYYVAGFILSIMFLLLIFVKGRDQENKYGKLPPINVELKKILLGREN